jgi:excisionase family DNA binding protein
MTTLNDLPPTMSIPQAAMILGISRRSAYRAAANDELPTIKVGRRLLVPTAQLLAMLGLPAPDPAFAAGRGLVGE